MLIIVGLGNPSAEYENTFHNMGFMAVDKLAQKLNKKIKRPNVLPSPPPFRPVAKR